MKDWSEACDLTGKGGGARVESVVAEDKGRSGDKRTPFKLNIEVDREAGSGSILAAFYAPVWIYNACTEPKLKLGVAAADSSIPFPPLELKEGEGGKVVVGKDSKNDTAAVVSGGGDGKKVGKGEAAAAMGEGKGVPKSNGGNTNPPAFMVGAGVEKVKVRFESDEAEGRAGFGTWSSSLVDLSVAGQSDVLQVISPTPSADSRRAKAAREVERRMMIKASRNSCGACAACRKPVNPIQQSAYSIGWQMSLAPAPFDRTLVLTMAPRFFIRNELPAKIAVRQALDGIPLLPEKPQKLGGGDSSIVHVEPGTHVAYHWSHAFLEQFVRFRLEAEAPLPRGGGSSSSSSSWIKAERSWAWSGPVAIDKPGDFGFLMRCHEIQFPVRVEVRSKGPSLFVVLKPENPLSPPVRIVNACALDTIRFSQRGDGLWTELPPYHETGYSWDYPLDPMALTLQISEEGDEVAGSGGGAAVAATQRRFTTARIEVSGEFPLKELYVAHRANDSSSYQHKVYMSLIQDGPTHLLAVSDVPLPGTKADTSVLSHLGYGIKIPDAKEQLQIIAANMKTVASRLRSRWRTLKSAHQEATETSRGVAGEGGDEKDGVDEGKHVEDKHRGGGLVEVLVMDIKDVPGATEGRQIDVNVRLVNTASQDEDRRVEAEKTVPLLSADARTKGVLLPAPNLKSRRITVSVLRRNKIFSDTFLGGVARGLEDLARERAGGDAKSAGGGESKAATPTLYSERWLPLNRQEIVRKKLDDGDGDDAGASFSPSDGEVLVRVAYYPSAAHRVAAVTEGHRVAVERDTIVVQALKPQLKAARARVEAEERMLALALMRSAKTSSKVFRCHCSCVSRSPASASQSARNSASRDPGLQSIKAAGDGAGGATETVKVWVVKSKLISALAPGGAASMPEGQGGRLLLVLTMKNQKRVIPLLSGGGGEDASPVSFDVKTPVTAATRLWVKLVRAGVGEKAAAAASGDTKEEEEKKKKKKKKAPDAAAWHEDLGSGYLSLATVPLRGAESVASRGEDFHRKAAGSDDEEQGGEYAGGYKKLRVELSARSSPSASSLGTVTFAVERRPMVAGGNGAVGSSRFTLALPEIGISMIDETPMEIFYLSLQWIIVSLATSRSTNSVELSVESLQFDRLHHSSVFPVILAPKPIAPELRRKQPFIQFGAAVAKTKPGAPVTIFRYFSFLVQEMDLKVEEALITRALAYFSAFREEALSANDPATEVWGSGVLGEGEVRAAIVLRYEEHNEPPPAGSSKMFFRLLELQPLALNLSFRLSGESSSGSSHTKRGGGGRTIVNPFKVLGQMAGATFGNLDDAPLRLNALTVENAYGDSATLLAPILAHYTSQGLGQAYKLVGSIAILGDPVGLVGNLGEGVADFFYEPAQGLVNSPQEFGLGLARGTVSLLKHTVVGVFSSASKVTSSIGRGVATLSMDQEYTLEHEKDMKRDPSHIGEGIYRGTYRLGYGLYRGVTGIFVDPVVGASKGGVAGFFKGLGIGVAGILVKPVVGVIDFGDLTLRGISNTAKIFDKRYENSLRRAKRYIALDRVLRPYNPSLSLIASQLREVKSAPGLPGLGRDDAASSAIVEKEVLVGAFVLSSYCKLAATTERVVAIIDGPQIKESMKSNAADGKRRADLASLSSQEKRSFQLRWSRISSFEADGSTVVIVTNGGAVKADAKRMAKGGKGVYRILVDASAPSKEEKNGSTAVAAQTAAALKLIQNIVRAEKEKRDQAKNRGGSVSLLGSDDDLATNFPPLEESKTDVALLLAPKDNRA